MQVNSISTFIFESYIFYHSEPDEMIKKYLPPTYPLLAILVNTVKDTANNKIVDKICDTS